MPKILSKFLRLLGEVGVATSSVIAPQSMNVEPVGPDKFRKRETLEDAIASEDFNKQDKWERIRQLDDHVYRYTKLDNLIDFAADHESGRRWDKIRYHSGINDTAPHLLLQGTRNDGEVFTVSEPISEQDNLHLVFDGLCEKLNSKLGVER